MLESVLLRPPGRHLAGCSFLVAEQFEKGVAPGERIASYLHAIGDALRPASAAFMTDLTAHAAAREIYQQNTAIAARRVAELIAEGVAKSEFRVVHASFVADTAAATMGRIQSGAILAATGLGDADAYDELATLLLDGIRERIRLPPRGGRSVGLLE